MIWNDIKVAGRIGILKVNRGWNPLPIQCERTQRRFNRTGRAQRMRVITFGPTDWNALCMLVEHFFDRRCFGAVIQLRRAGVCIDIIDLLGRQLCVRQCVAHRADA